MVSVWDVFSQDVEFMIRQNSFPCRLSPNHITIMGMGKRFHKIPINGDLFLFWLCISCNESGDLVTIDSSNVASSVSGAYCSHRVVSKTYTFSFLRCVRALFGGAFGRWPEILFLFTYFLEFLCEGYIHLFAFLRDWLVGSGIRFFSSATRKAWISLQNELSKKSVSPAKFVISKWGISDRFEDSINYFSTSIFCSESGDGLCNFHRKSCNNASDDASGVFIGKWYLILL